MISIIIPAFNEDESLPKLISFLNSNSGKKEIEIIVSDGGSTDHTVQKSINAGAIVVKSPKKGRASQMNYGASKAKGSTLYFLHADSYPPKAFVDDINQAVIEGIEAGCYRLAFDHKHILLKFYSWFTKFDIDLFRFGDQSLFITKKLFQNLNGFDEELILMEDQMFVKDVKKNGSFTIINGEVVTSARKYRQVGIVKLQFIFSVILVLFYLGVSQEALLKFYKKHIR